MTNALQFKTSGVFGMRAVLKRGVSALAIASVISGQIAPAWSEALATSNIAGSAGYASHIKTDPVNGADVFNITGKKQGSSDIMVYDQFQLGTQGRVNFHLREGSERIVNIMQGTAGVSIEGQVNSHRFGTTAIGGDVYFVTPGGFVLGENGSINAGRLVVTTPTADFRDDMLRNSGNSGDFAENIATIDAGKEPLGNGGIEILGQIEARALSLRSGARMMLNGQITVTGAGEAGSGLPVSALNRGKVEDAAGVVIRDGVISLKSASDLEIGGRLTAQNGVNGGAAITAQAENITLKMDKANSALIAGQASDQQSSFIIMFAADSLLAENATKLEAKGQGGLVWLGSKQRVTLGTEKNAAEGVLGGSANSTVMLEGAEVMLDGHFATSGGQVLIEAKNIGIKGNLKTGGGDVIASGRHITLQGGEINTIGTAGSGLIALVAEHSNIDQAWPISARDAHATITLTNATLKGGAVVIHAVARAGTGTNVTDPGTEAKQIADHEALNAAFFNSFSGETITIPADGDQPAQVITQPSLSDVLEALIDAGVDAAQNASLGALKAAAGQLVVAIPINSATATVTITDSNISSDGRRASLNNTRLEGNPDWEEGARGLDAAITADGLISDAWKLKTPAILGDKYISLPADWNAPDSEANRAAGGALREDVYIRAHSETLVETGAGSAMPVPVSVVGAYSKTNSAVKITGDSTITSARDLALRSTLRDAMAVEFKGAKIGGLTLALNVTVQEVENLLQVDAKKIQAGGKAIFEAKTIRSHDTTVQALAGSTDWLAVALNVGISNNRTEAAVTLRPERANDPSSGGLSAQTGIDLTAQTLYLSNSRVTEAVVSENNPTSAVVTKNPDVEPVITGLSKAIKSNLGMDPNSKPKTLGLGFGIDVNAFQDDTFASLNGGNSATNRPGLVILPNDLPSAALNVRSSLDYRTSTALSGPVRRAVSRMGDFGTLLKAKAAALQLNYDQLIGQHTDGLFVAGALSYLGSDTKAEVGGTIKGGTLSLEARTDLGSLSKAPSGLWDSVQQWKDYAAALETLKGLPAQALSDLSAGNDSDAPAKAAEVLDTQPEIPDLMGYLSSFLTPTSGVNAAGTRSPNPEKAASGLVDGAGKPVTDAAQNMAVGMGLNAFMTNANTGARILDGAVIETAGDVHVNAVEKSAMIFGNNFLPTQNPFNDGPATALGGTLGAQVNRGSISATVGKAQISARDLNVTALNDRFMGQLVYAGRGGREKGISLSLGANITLKNTTALVSGNAKIDLARDLKIQAKDDTINWAVAAGLSGASSGGSDKPATAVGGAVIVNYMERDVYAGIGFAKGEIADNNGYVTFKGKADIKAVNNAIDIGVAAAGAVTAETAKPPSAGGAEADDDNILMSLNPLVGQDVIDKMNLFETLDIFNDLETASTDEVGSQKTGLSLAGSGVANIIVSNATRSEVAAGAKLQGTGRGSLVDPNLPGAITNRGDISIAALNSGLTIGASGAVSVALQTQNSADALAGALSITLGKRDALVTLGGTLASDEGTIKVNAKDDSHTVNVAVGGAGTSKGDKAVAGSVAMNLLLGETRVDVDGATLAAGEKLDLSARDSSWQLAVGGAVAVNMNMEQGLGFGLGVGSNNYARDALVTLRNGADLSAKDIDIEAGFAAKLYGFGISGGVSAGGDAAAGSVSVNTITSDAKVVIGDVDGTAPQVKLRAVNQIGITAKDEAQIWALAGALSFGKGTAVGAAGAVNVITGQTLVKIDHALLEGLVPEATPDLPDPKAALSVQIFAKGDSKIRSLAAAGAASGKETALGAGITVNTISADAGIYMANSTVSGAKTFKAHSSSKRDIQSIAGGAAVSAGKGAGGAALAVNLILGNDTTTELSGNDITASAVEAKATAEGKIRSASVALGASTGSAVAGSVSVNVITGQTRADIKKGTIKGATSVSQLATDDQTIKVIAGNAALGTGGVGVGVAIAANVIAQNTTAIGGYDMQGTSSPTLSAIATNSAEIAAIAATGAAGSSSAAGVSAAIGDIGNRTEASLKTNARQAGNITVSASNDSDIDILAGALGAGMGGAGVGAAVTLAMIHDTTYAGLDANALTRAGDISVTAYKEGDIKAAAIGAGGGSGAGVGASFVYTMIGRESEVEGLSAAHSFEKSNGDGSGSTTDVTRADAATAKDDIMSQLSTNAAAAGVSPKDLTSLGGENPVLDDVTEARVQLKTAGSFGGITVRAEDKARIASLSGSAAVGGSAGVGAGVTVNLLFGATKASLELAQGRSLANSVSVLALQTGDIQSHAYALGGGGAAGIAGAVNVNVMQRGLLTQVHGNGAQLQTNGHRVTVAALQKGEVDSIAGVLAFSGAAGVSGAITVSYVNDSVASWVDDVAFDTRKTGVADLSSAGVVRLEARSDLEVMGSAASAGLGGIAGVSGAVVVNVGAGQVSNGSNGLTVYAKHLHLLTRGDRNFTAYSGVLSGGLVGVGLATSVNTSSVKVTSQHDAMTARLGGDGWILTHSDAGFGGLAIGIAGAGVAVVGTAVANNSHAEVKTELNSADLVARGNLTLRSDLTAAVTLDGGDDSKVAAVTGGAAVGVFTGAGAAVSVNIFKGKAETRISDQSRLAALGQSLRTPQGGTRGLIIEADSSATVNSATIMAASGIGAATGAISTIVLEDLAQVQIGDLDTDGISTGRVVLNEKVTPDVLEALGAETAHINQDTLIKATSTSNIDAIVGAAAAGIGAGGAAISVVVAENAAKLRLAGAIVAANRDITLSAVADNNIGGTTAGAAAGVGAGASTISTRSFGATAKVDLLGSDLVAGNLDNGRGNIDISAATVSVNRAKTGAFSGGGVGGSGAISVTTSTNTAEIEMAGLTEVFTEPGSDTAESTLLNSDLLSLGDLNLSAQNQLTIDAETAGGAGGVLGGVTLVSQVLLAGSAAQVNIGADQILEAGQNLTAAADDTITSATRTGAASAAGIAAVGIAVDIQRFDTAARVNIGANAELLAGNDINLSANSSRAIDVGVVAGSAGGLIGITAAISTIDIGGTLVLSEEDNKEEKKAKQDALDETRAALAGSDAQQSEVLAGAQNLNLDGAFKTTESASVNIGAGAQIIGGKDVTLSAQSLTDVTQNTGALAAGGLVGAASGTGLIYAGAGARVELSRHSDIHAEGALTLSAYDGQADDGIKAVSHTVAGAGIAAVAVGVARVDTSGSAKVVIAGDNQLSGGHSAGGDDGINISALRDLTSALSVKNSAVGGLVGIGAAVAHGTDRGIVEVSMGSLGGESSLSGGFVNILAKNASGVNVVAEAGAGGVYAGMSGVDARALLASKTSTSIRGVRITGDRVQLSTQATPEVEATAKGKALGAVASGLSLAKAELSAQVTADFQGAIRASSITIETALRGEGARASASSSAGGIGAGGGADATAHGDYKVLADLRGDLVATGGGVTINTLAEDFGFSAKGDGAAGGLVAAGAVTSFAGQEKGETGQVALTLDGMSSDDILLARDGVTINTINAPSYSTNVRAGSKGLFAGSAASAQTIARLSTSAQFGTRQEGFNLAARDLSILTATRPDLRSYVNATTANLVGASGASENSRVEISQDMQIGARSMITADRSFGMASLTRISSGALDGKATIYGGSGGLAGGAAVASAMTTNVVNTFAVSDGAWLGLGALGGLDRMMSLEALNEYDILNRAELHADGAIAIPKADIEIRSERSDALLSVNNAELSSKAGLRLSAGNQVKILAYANVSTTGLAGAAAGQTRADFTGKAQVSLARGTKLFAEQDVELLAGYAHGQLQNFDLQAETRLYNKTAAPISTKPEAEAIARDASLVQIEAGADIKAVRDIIVAAEGGDRLIRGFGRGTDLYRQVLAEIASTISGIFGGQPVSLDIISGSSKDEGNHGMVLNGNLRAGARNIQVLYFDADNQVHYGDYADDVLAHAQTDWGVGTGSAATKALRERLAQVDKWLGDESFASNAVALAAWGMEKSRINDAIAEMNADATRVQISVDDIRASAGNIQLRGSHVAGGGVLNAPGDALIEVKTTASSNAILAIGNLTIDNYEGGTISFNGTRIADNQMLTGLSKGEVAPQLTLISAESDPAQPLINVMAGVQNGRLLHQGDVFNLGGKVTSAAKDIAIYGDVRAADVAIAGARSVSMEYRPGVRSTSAQNPEDSYGDYFTRVENRIRSTVRAGSVGEEFTYRAGSFMLPSFPEIKPSQAAGIFANSSIFISADMVNINSTIRAGIGAYDIKIGEGLDQVLQSLRGNTDILLYNPMTGEGLASAQSHITSNAAVYWDPVNKRVKVADIEALGGDVTIVGDIFSTGNGRIEVLDGFSALKVDSQSKYTLELGRVLIGGELDEAGLAKAAKGKVSLWDYDYSKPKGQQLVLTEYTREANGDRLYEYATKADRDYIYTSVSETKTVVTKRREELILAGGKVDESKNVIKITNESKPSVSVVAQAPYLGSSLGGQDYAYAVVGKVIERGQTVKSAEVKTHDSVRWYKAGSGYRHYTWTESHDTVEQFDHRVKADYAIAISFTGADVSLGAQTIDINSVGSVMFGGIVNNYAGTAIVTSTGGNITASDSNAVLSGLGMTFSAAAGSIGSKGQALNLALVEGQAVTASAANGIHLGSVRGDLLVGDITTSRSDDLVSSQGAISLSARGNLLQKDGSVIKGSDITLKSTTATIGGGKSLRIDLQGAGRLSALASGDIDVTEVAGDMSVASVVSQAGNVTLRAPTGAILDGLSDAQSDFRTKDELVAIWRDELGLTADGARSALLIGTYEAERERMYRDYWTERNAAGGANLPADFTPDAATVAAWEAQRADLVKRNLSTTELDAEIAEWTANRQAFWRSLDAQTEYTSNYSYQASSAERDLITQAALFDQEQMLRSISSDVVRRTTSTQDGHEAANVTAFGNISLYARDGVGQDLPDVVIDLTKPLSNTDLLLLSRSLAHNVSHDAGAGVMRLRRFDDLNVAMTGGLNEANGLGSGILNVTSQSAGRSIFIGSDKGLRLGEVASAGGVTLRANGSIVGSNIAGTDISTRGNLVLESARGTIGTPQERLKVAVAVPVDDGDDVTGVVNLRAAGDIALSATGALALAEVYSRALVDLHATAAITDAFTSETPRIVARDMILSAASIGTQSQALGLELERKDDGTLGAMILGSSTGDMRVKIYEDARITAATAAGDMAIAADGDLALAGRLVTPGAISLDVAGDLTVEGAQALGHLSAKSLTLTAGQVGADGAAVQISQTGTEGLIRLTTTTGALHADLVSAARLASMDLATGGRLLAQQDLALVGADVIGFGAEDLTLDLAGRLDLSEATGTDISGSTLRLRSAGDVGRGADRLETALDNLSADVAGRLHVTDSDDLVAEALSAGPVLDLLVGNDLTLAGSVTADQAVFTAQRDLRVQSAEVSAQEMQLFAVSGNIEGQLGSAGLNSLTAYAAGAVDLTGDAGLKVRYAIAGSDLTLTSAKGDLTAGALQGVGLVKLAAAGDVNVTAIGVGQLTRADQAGFGLQALPVYGPHILEAASTIDLTAGGAIRLGLGRADNVELTSDDIDAVISATSVNGHLNAAVHDNGDQIGPIVHIETVVAQPVGDLTTSDFDTLRAGLDRKLRDAGSIYFDGPVSQDAILIHRGHRVQFAEQDAQLDQRIIRGDEILRISRVFLGVDGDVQLELWLSDGARLNVDLGAGANVLADPVLAIETRQAGYMLNNVEVLAEDTARGLVERLGVTGSNGLLSLQRFEADAGEDAGEDAEAGDGKQPLLRVQVAPHWNSFRRDLNRTPLILGALEKPE